MMFFFFPKNQFFIYRHNKRSIDKRDINTLKCESNCSHDKSDKAQSDIRCSAWGTRRRGTNAGDGAIHADDSRGRGGNHNNTSSSSIQRVSEVEGRASVVVETRSEASCVRGSTGNEIVRKRGNCDGSTAGEVGERTSNSISSRIGREDKDVSIDCYRAGNLNFRGSRGRVIE